MDTLKKILVGGAMVLLIVFVFFAAWYIFFRQSGTNTPPGTTVKNSQSFTTTPTNQTGETPVSQTPIDTSGINAKQKIFKIADGPIASAVFVETKNPTTTLVRYVKQDSGHVSDIPVSVEGSIARVVSGTTIPGIGSSFWQVGGGAVVLQYSESGAVKTLSLTLPRPGLMSATNSSSIHFFPNNIMGIAGSPDGTQVAYLLKTKSGVAGYVANSNASGARQVFTLPYSQVLISWPAKNTLLVQTKGATGVAGIAFSVSTGGLVTPLVYAESLSATANTKFSKIVYSSTQNSEGLRQTYSHDVKTGKDELLPFNPIPEKCVWGTASTTLYCAAPLDSTPTNYLDLWHSGQSTQNDSIFAFDLGKGITSMAAAPGGVQGGVAADMAQVAVSPDNQYLLYITRGDRALWGVKIGN